MYISQLILFARICYHWYLTDVHARNKCLTAGYRYHTIRIFFSQKNHLRNYGLSFNFTVRLKTLLRQGLYIRESYSELVYQFDRIMGRTDFSDQFRKQIVCYKCIGYNLTVIRRSADLVI